MNLVTPQRAFTRVKVAPLTPSIGAEISGIALAEKQDDATIAEIRSALLAYKVIFFRDQKMSVEQHKEFGRRFGPLHVHPNAPIEFKEHPEILVIKADEKSKYVAGEEWHSDVSCDPEPPMGSILYLKEVPPDGGGDTLFANMYRAFETLSAPIQKLCEGLTAIHDGAQVYGGRFGQAPVSGLPVVARRRPAQAQRDQDSQSPHQQRDALRCIQRPHRFRHPPGLQPRSSRGASGLGAFEHPC